MNPLRGIINQPVTVAVGVVLLMMAGLIALKRIPIQLTPNVEDTIIGVSTFWEGASPEEVEREIIERQEEKLQGLTGLRSMTSQSQQGVGSIRLEFVVGTSKDAALREVSDKLREVPEYPDHVDEPVISATDPENQDYIAWIIFGTTDPNLDIRTLQDFAEDRIKPVLERVPGVSEVNVLGGRERETQIRFDPRRLAQFGITPTQLADAIRGTNTNVSAGRVPDAKFDVRIRTVSQYESVSGVTSTVVAQTDAGPVTVGDLADVVETYKEASTFVRSKGRPVIAINAQKEVGSNVMEVMDGIRAVVTALDAPGSVLETKARELGLGPDDRLTLRQVYDQTIYIDEALALVLDNIWLGGGIAVIVLLVFLRSLRSVGIITLAIPISVIGAIVVMVALGRTINVISLAGMAFAVGMVVDNAIVVLENIFRHLEMGKRPARAALDGSTEVWGAIVASTLTTIVVFIPILLIQDEAGQLFRDIALAICAAVGLSLVVSITVIPVAAARVLRPMRAAPPPTGWRRIVRAALWPLRAFGAALHRIPDVAAWAIHAMCGSVIVRLVVVIVLTAASIIGSTMLMPPADYLPTGNRNLVFGLLIPPPGYNLDQQAVIGGRIEETIRPFWEAGDFPAGSAERARAVANLPPIPTFNWMTQQPGDPVVPPPIENYFVVGLEGIMFHGAIAEDAEKVADVIPLFGHATRSEVIPGVLGFAFQVPLFRLGGSTGSAIKIDLTGDDLDQVTASASAVYQQLGQTYGWGTIQPSPSNFNIFGPEIQVVPNRRALADLGLTPSDLGLAVQANGDGAIIGEYRIAGDSIDLKLIASDAVDRRYIGQLEDIPMATTSGAVVPLRTVATFRRVTSAPQINHVGRQRSVTLQFTPPSDLPLGQAIDEIRAMLDEMRTRGSIAHDVGTTFAGSASKLESVRLALLGDGTVLGTMNSSLVLALVVVYLLMCVLFQSFAKPFVIMFSVPLATLGGFAALYAVSIWSYMDPYMPIQKLDVLTMLGFVILIGIVVNNAILIVHQAQNFMLGRADDVAGVTEPLPARRAISESVRTRVRPIFMSTLTSLGGMAPLVLMPGSGSELYRGLGSVVLGGLLVSTIFTIVLVPLLLSLVLDLQAALGLKTAPAGAAEPTLAPTA
ncbi:MAG: efflux RND transporter permease subunit [Phycisphaerales bacterium]|nr:efflux RND transporter permease subunit [Phycisphaerales bacterium]